MRNIEHDIEDIIAARLLPASEPPLSIARRIEDFALENMRSLAFGAAGALLTLSALLALSRPDYPSDLKDPATVNSITDLPSRRPAPTWQAIRKPVELISLQAPQFGRQAAVYSARISPSGEREDALLFETNQPELPEARLSLRRSASPQAQTTMFVDMARQQAERGMAITRAGSIGKLSTKFGNIDVADMVLADSAGRGQSCLAFRSEGAISIAGWYCAPQAAAAERPEVACFIDRLSLLKAGEDRDLRRFFSEAEQRRRPCPTSRTSTGRKPTWLDADGRIPAMRSDITGAIGEKTPR
ncbi:MAG: hypothetical protein IOC90_16780 [Methylocystis sp.]|nr:hypothetical protein [Methylocystis sp.]MCA3583856.1 hypothetical protein [Methylocystis sp.]MCA3589666.1 hypothetical protein [Methylocystis sp.]MCA3593184.1 hypothetical protein [Methylocystis sp.]